MALPTRYRDTVQDSCNGHMVLTLDVQQKCLLLYPLPDWQEIERKVAALPSFSNSARRLQRILIGYAADIEMDANGRVVVPAPLRAKVGLDKNVVLVGQGRKFEVWDEAAWDAECEAMEAEDILDADDIPDDLKSLSL